MLQNPGQLPLVKANISQINTGKDEDLCRFGLYQQFADVAILEENKGVDKNNLDELLLKEFLSQLRNSVNAKNDYNLLRTKYSHCSVGSR